LLAWIKGRGRLGNSPWGEYHAGRVLTTLWQFRNVYGPSPDLGCYHARDPVDLAQVAAEIHWATSAMRRG